MTAPRVVCAVFVAFALGAWAGVVCSRKPDSPPPPRDLVFEQQALECDVRVAICQAQAIESVLARCVEATGSPKPERQKHR